MISDMRCFDIAELSYKGPWCWISPGHTRAVWVEEEGYGIIGFQGTTRDGKEILRDIRFMPYWHHRVGICPVGFLRGVISIMDQIEMDVAEYARAGKLVIVGHSLGGAEAEICAGWFCALGFPPAKLFAIEPPRSGGWKLRRLLKMIDDKTATEDGNDLVTRVPWLYGHPTPLTYFGREHFDPLAPHRLAVCRAAWVDRLAWV